ncbi:ExeA family protein, partial [Pelomonas sp. KK5]|uniref:ExeA family protein n=1 Tax=Pelomonas sp. KK5 TaxID=1855730 RepID=UPI001301E05D
LQLFEIGQVFDPRPDPALYFPTVAAEMLRLRLRASLQGGEGGLRVLSGESGSGKSLLVSVLLQRLPRPWVHAAQLRFSTMAGEDLLRAIAHAFGLGTARPRESLAAALAERGRRGEGSLLVIDDAQGLSAEALRLVHGLVGGQVLLAILLVGSGGLMSRLQAADLAPIAADFHPRFEMGAFGPRESEAFIRDRLARCKSEGLPAFTAGALVEIDALARGIPGRINMLCRELLHQALLSEDGRPIDAGQVAAQGDALGLVRLRRPLLPQARPAAVMAAPAPSSSLQHLRYLLAAPLLAGLAFALWRPGEAPSAQQPAEAVPAAATAEPPTHPRREVITEAAPAAPRVIRAQPPSSPLPDAHARECAAVLTQLSLGEPLNPKQKRTLETLCR